MPNQIKTDLLVVGCGVAGATAALSAADAGIQVTVITNAQEPEEGNTAYAQGGIIYQGNNDSPELLTKDIMNAGAGKSYPRAVRFLAEKGPELVETLLLKKYNVPFDRNEAGDLDMTMEGAHSSGRIIHAADLTGKAIIDSLTEALKNHSNIRVETGMTAIDLLTLSHHSLEPTDVYKEPTCVGIYVLNQETKKVSRFLAKETILATGGLGQIYLHTTNPRGARGDGIAFAYRAGARLINLEFVQFHPTALYHSERQRFLISESVRGVGA